MAQTFCPDYSTPYPDRFRSIQEGANEKSRQWAAPLVLFGGVLLLLNPIIGFDIISLGFVAGTVGGVRGSLMAARKWDEED